MKQCSVCKEIKPATLEFFNKKSSNKKTGLSPECRVCRNKWVRQNNVKIDVNSQHKKRKQKHKTDGIKLLGGKCVNCGVLYDSTNGSIFDFHHTNPAVKDFTIGNHFNKSWSILKPEIEKCILLCSNCHRLEHSETY